eukprot:m.143243 g.143243  ORF g.143243 m.143243 type:complete len:953 (-) comp14085_c0_seq3:237-3095(-)
MYGVVTIAVEEFLLTLEDGQALWEEVKSRVGLKEDISFYEHYSDDLTLRLVKAAAAVTGLSYDDVLRGTADAQLKPLVERGYKPLADSLGASFFECLGHIDTMHQNLVNSYPGMVAPSFRPQLAADGTVYLHYYSARAGFWPYAQNLLMAVAKAIYNIDVTFDHHQKKHEGHDHDIFIVHMPPEGFGQRDESSLAIAANKFAKYDCDSSTFNQLFPWHLEVDRNLKVVSMGSLLQGRFQSPECLKSKSQTNPSLRDVIKIKQPAFSTPTFDALADRDHCTFMAVVRDDWYFEQKALGKADNITQKTSLQEKKKKHSMTSPLSESGCPFPMSVKDYEAEYQQRRSSHSRKLHGTSGCPLSHSQPASRKKLSHGVLATLSEDKPTNWPSRASRGSMLQSLAANPSALESVLSPGPLTRTISDSLSQMMQMRRASSTSRASISSIEAEAYITEAVGYLFLRGEIVYRKDTDTIMLLGNPECSTPNQLYLRGLSLKDLPVHSNTRERLFSAAHQLATISNAGCLESTTKQLARAKADIQVERRRVHDLLHSILPEEVAISLSVGKIPEAKHFSHVTILFSDVPSFEKIVGSVRPTQVMDLLNDMFSKFDDLCKSFGLYKVETIGDSYMVASGIPTQHDKQATNMAAFAIKMMQAGNSFLSPIDGSQLTLRIGMHTGNIMAGVVGKTRPRYCLFGDTVNVASRMESTTTPGTIQYSASTMSALMAEKAEFKWISRGDIDIKGKGAMETFFLLGLDKEHDFLLPPKALLETSRPSHETTHLGHNGKLGQDSTVSLQQQLIAHSEMMHRHLTLLHAQVNSLRLHIAGKQHKQAPKGFFSVHIHRLAGATSICDGVAHETQLKDVVDTVLAASETHMKLFTSTTCSTLVLQSVSIGELVKRRYVQAVPNSGDNPKSKCYRQIHLFAVVECDADALDIKSEMTILKDLGVLPQMSEVSCEV